MLFVQSYLGGVALPSYLHARLPGNVGAPVMPYRKLFGVAWHAQGAPAVAESLDGMKALKTAVKQLAWKKHSQEGHVALEWVLQVRAMGDGTSELIFQIGSPAMDLYDTGLGACLAVREALRPALPEQPMAKQGLYFPSPYEHIYDDVLHEP